MHTTTSNDTVRILSADIYGNPDPEYVLGDERQRYDRTSTRARWDALVCAAFEGARRFGYEVEHDANDIHGDASAALRVFYPEHNNPEHVVCRTWLRFDNNR